MILWGAPSLIVLLLCACLHGFHSVLAQVEEEDNNGGCANTVTQTSTESFTAWSTQTQTETETIPITETSTSVVSRTTTKTEVQTKTATETETQTETAVSTATKTETETTTSTPPAETVISTTTLPDEIITTTDYVCQSPSTITSTVTITTESEPAPTVTVTTTSVSTTTLTITEACPSQHSSHNARQAQCTPDELLVDWTNIDVYQGGDGFVLWFNHASQSLLTIVDAGYRTEKYQVYQDESYIGETGDYAADWNQWCPVTASANNVAECWNGGWSLGQFTIWPGAHNIKIINLSTGHPSWPPFSTLFYKVEAVCD